MDKKDQKRLAELYDREAEYERNRYRAQKDVEKWERKRHAARQAIKELEGDTGA